MKSLIVGISDCKVTRDEDAVLITYALGSCIAVASYDPVAKVAGLLHYMLPEASLDAEKARQNPFMFADTGIARLVEAVQQAGGVPKRMKVRLAGGAQVLGNHGAFQIGKRNYLAAKKILWKAGILIDAEAVGGEVARTTRIEAATGRMFIREGGGIERELTQQRHGLAIHSTEGKERNGVLCTDRG
jgi:chemotaxis protein CheD